MSKSSVLFSTVAMVGTLLSGLAARADVTSVDVGQNLEYQQTDVATVVPINGGSNAFFFARAFYTDPSEFDGGSVVGPVDTHAFNFANAAGRGYQTGYMTPAAMAAEFPTGSSYAITATNSVSSASTTATVPFAADYSDSATPMFTNYAATQAFTANTASTLDFNTPQGNAAATFDQTFLTVYDTTTSTSVASLYFGTPTTSASFAAGTFTAGNTYEAQLIFDDGVTGTDALSGIPYTARSDLRTDLYFTVQSGVPEPAAWSVTLLGCGLIGATLRRRRLAVRAA